MSGDLDLTPESNFQGLETTQQSGQSCVIISKVYLYFNISLKFSIIYLIMVYHHIIVIK